MQAERKFLQAQWRSKNKALQIKAAELATKLTEEHLGEYKGVKDYIAVRSLRDRLIEGAEKNFLGYYKGEAGVWDKLVRAYEIESEQFRSHLTVNFAGWSVNLLPAKRSTLLTWPCWHHLHTIIFTRCKLACIL